MSRTTEFKKLSATPRISVNKLAEYLEASPTRRKKIVFDAKNPEKFIVTRYRDAREGIINYLSGNSTEDDILGLIESIESKDAGTDFQIGDNKLSCKALESVLDNDFSIFNGYVISSNTFANTLMNISGVDISVNPDLIVTDIINDIPHIGAAKIHISLSPLSEESQKIVSVLLYIYVRDYIIEQGAEANTKLCFSIDVFGRRIESCPKAYKQRLARIETACEEIALWWDKL